MNHWVDALVALQASGTAAVVVSVVGTRGSVPRAAGTHMIVTREKLHGTIGGGHLEFQAIGIARDLIGGAPGAQRLRRFPLGASLGQCCGGVVNLLFEPVAGPAEWIAHAATLRNERTPFVTLVPTTGDDPAGRLVVTAREAYGDAIGDRADAIALAREVLRSGESAQLVHVGADGTPRWFVDPVRDDGFDVVLFGAGHVGRALVKLFADLPCHVTWIDTRDDEFPSEIPVNVSATCSDAPEADVDAAPPGVFFLVMTHDHALDERIAERILERNNFAYFGLIGSLPKRRRFEQRMARRGMPAERFAAMTCPIGVAGIEGKEPATIAVAVVAQILQLRSALAARPAEAGPTRSPLAIADLDLEDPCRSGSSLTAKSR
ncbi:MAG: xanthine dehydrogenase accessory protein XdhC [Casimicrobiaceae bacterium]